MAVRVHVPSRIDFAGGWTDVPDFSGDESGAVLNAAIDCAVEGEASWDESGFRLSCRLDVEPDSHLGTSSASNLAYVELIDGLTRRERTPVERAELAWRLEQLLGEKSGKQDHYAAALGGINLLRFGAADEAAEIEPVVPSDEHVAALEARLLLCHSGKSPDSGAQHAMVWERFRNGDRAIRDGLRAIRDTVVPARDALVAEEWETLGELLTRNRELARGLGGGAVTERMDELFSAGEGAGALGAKPCGAGGGGYLLFLVAPERRDAVAQALEEAGGCTGAVRIAARRDGSSS